MVKVGQFTSNSITLNVGAQQGCVLSPLLYSLYTHDCVPSHSSTYIVKFANDTVVLGLISNNDETAYLDEVERLTSWCQDNCLSLNMSKTKELIVDFRKRTYSPLMISGNPCGEGEQLQVPRCKHLRGPDLDCTHSNTDQESQAKTVLSATAEEIQGLTRNPKSFLFRGHRKCIAGTLRASSHNLLMSCAILGYQKGSCSNERVTLAPGWTAGRSEQIRLAECVEFWKCVKPQWRGFTGIGISKLFVNGPLNGT